MPAIRLATASPATQPTLKETLAQLASIARRAATPSASNPQPADILLLPEAYLGGYPRGSTFGAAVGGRTAEGRNEYLEYFKGAVDLGDIVGEAGAGAGDAWVRREIGGKRNVAGAAHGHCHDEQVRGDGTREELERIARETGVFLVVGCVERAGGSLYCAVVYVCPSKGIIGKRRKVMPTGSERLIWAQGSPATLKAVTTIIRGIRINLVAVICWENYMPMVRQSVYAQNVNLYLAPTADARDAWLSLIRTIGIEGRCFVVSSNMAVRGSTSSSKPTAAASAASSVVTYPGVTDGAGALSHASDESPHPRSPTIPRRNSIFDEDGNEIVLPVKHAGSPPATTRRTPRRNSIICEDGNEIILPTPKSPTSPFTSKFLQSPPPPLARQIAAPAETQEWSSRGGSCIVSPFGDVLAGPQWEDDDGIIYADVDFDECIRGRLDLDTAGSYSRNDSFKLSVEGLNLEALPY